MSDFGAQNQHFKPLHLGFLKLQLMIDIKKSVKVRDCIIKGNSYDIQNEGNGSFFVFKINIFELFLNLYVRFF